MGGNGKREIKEPDDKYIIKKKELKLVIEELKKRLTAKKTKIKRYKGFPNLARTDYLK